MNSSTKPIFIIAGINLLILAVYQYGLATDGQGYSQLSSALTLGFHALGLLILGLVFHAMSKTNYGHGFLISAGLVLVIGYGTCALFIR